jgi:hypothetical protein
MEHKYRRSIFWPLLLVTIGVIFLLNTLGIIPGDGWELFLKLWPLLFLIGGLDNIFQGRGYIWGVISLGLGTVFLLANFGYLEWSSFGLLLRLWPLLLVAAGLDLIFRGRSLVTTIVSVLLAVIIVAGILWFTLSGGILVQQEVSPLSQALGSAEKLNIQITNPAGRVEILSGASTGQALEGELTLAPRQSIDQSYDVRNGIGDLRLKSSDTVFLPWSGGFNQPKWDIQLTEAVPISLTVSTAAGNQLIDLTALNIEKLDLAVAVGEMDVVLPADGEFSGRLGIPVGIIKVNIPEGALVEFRVNGVFLSKSIPPGYSASGNIIYSSGANSNNANMYITIDQPIGRLILMETN